LAKTVNPKTRDLEASGADDERVRGMPPVRPTERL
jgi:hypothetical protein